jgi:hypothetical protein
MLAQIQKSDVKTNMTIKIIDNKKIDLTEEEWQMYSDICLSYNRTNFRGEELFKDLFSTNNKGIITGIRPPSYKYTSFEVISFMFIIMNNQQLRIIRTQVDRLCADINEKVDKKLAELQLPK